MTTYEFAMRDKAVLRKVAWEYIIIDEAHRLKNPKCNLVQALGGYNMKARRIAITGTPLQNSLPELWSLLNFLHPNIFNSCDNFERWFATPLNNMAVGPATEKEKQMGMSEEEKLLVINRLHSILRPFMLRRQKSEVRFEIHYLCGNYSRDSVLTAGQFNCVFVVGGARFG
jgi:SNF2 family DNA or RNA helicase